MSHSIHNPHGWSLAEKLKGYYLWSRSDHGKLIWNVTGHDRPPCTDAGYNRTEAILQLKGISQ